MNNRVWTVNFPMMAKVLGWILMMESCFMLVPFATSLYYGEYACARSFFLTLSFSAVLGAVMTFCIHPHHTNMRSREGIMITGLVWVLMSLLGCIPFLLTGVLTSFPDAFFEMMSGFTTTGASVIRDVEIVPKGLLIWRSLTQWIGGMGIILFTLAVVPMLNHSGGLSLFNAEVTGITHDKLRPRVSQTAKSLWMVYIVLTAVLFGLLCLGPMNVFDALCTTLSTTSTGGFSTRNASVMYWNSTYVNLVLTIFMFVCGVNFSLLYKFAKGDVKSLLSNDTLKWYFGFMALCSVIVGGMFFANKGDTTDTALHTGVQGFFEVISAATSTGFSAVDYESHGSIVAIIIFLVMIFGSCAGSTAGGAKIDRMVLMMKCISNEIYHVMHPNSIEIIRINGRAVTSDAFNKTAAFLSIYMLIIVVCTVVYSAYGVPPFDSLFVSVSMISNIGFGYGFTGINGSFADLSSVSKLVGAFEMLIGRLELFTIIVLFTRGFWKKY